MIGATTVIAQGREHIFETFGFDVPLFDDGTHGDEVAGDGVYAVPQDLLDFRDTIRQIVRERVWPRAAEIDESGEYPRDIRELFAEHDILALPFAEE